MIRKVGLCGLLCVVAGMLVRCSDDDDNGNGPVPPTTVQVQVANALTPVTIDANRRLDSVVVYGLKVDGVSYGTLHAGDMTAFAAVTVSGSTVSVTADSFRIYFQICNPCSPETSSVASPGPYTFTVTVGSNETLVLDTAVVRIGTLITTTTTVMVSNQMLAIALPVHGGQADSVHMYGVRIGSLTFGDIRAGQVTSAQNTTAYGTRSLTVDSLVVVRGATRTTLTGLSPLTVTVNQYSQNTVTVGASTYPIDDLLPMTTTTVQVSNQMLAIALPVHGGQADSVHMYGVRIGSLSFGNVRAGQASNSLTTTTYGTQSLTVDSLVVVRGSVRTKLTGLGAVSVTVNQYSANTVVVDGSTYPIDNLLPGGGDTTRVQIRNRLMRFNDAVDTDSVLAVLLVGVRVNGVSFGTIDTGVTTALHEVIPRNNTVTLTFQRTEVWDLYCITPVNCFEQQDLARECADSVVVTVQSGQDNLIDFSPGTAVTADLWDGMGMCP